MPGHHTGRRNPDAAKGVFVVKNDKGLHTRPSTELVKNASQFKASISLIHKNSNTIVSAKSLLGILSMAATKGTRIEIEAVGEDAETAVCALCELAENQFYIKY